MGHSFLTVIVPDEPSLQGARIAMHAADRHALLRVSGRAGVRELGVACFADPSVPPDRVVLAESLAARLGLQAGDGVEVHPRLAKPLAEIMLESLAEEPSERLWKAIGGDHHLVGQCFWTGEDPDAVLMGVGDGEFRVSSFDEPAPSELRVVTPDTTIELFMQGSRIGLDMVILADTSGSMSVDDLPAGPSERHGFGLLRAGPGNVRRVDALKAALNELLDARLHLHGRESRIALLSFSTRVLQRFPSQPGMVSVDGSCDPVLVEEFRRAIASLEAKGETAMSEAILTAAELLDRYGKEDNERLIVLVSDGKPYNPKPLEATGEVVRLIDDEVGLVRHLFAHRGIRLQTIGISDEVLYRA